MTTTVFDGAAAAYDRLRPAYPADVYDAIARLSGIPLAEASVAEVGAGTGIATRGLRTRGARVVAIDLSLAMLRLQGSAADRAVARGERLPLWWNIWANRDARWVRAREEPLRQHGPSWAGCYVDDYALTELDADLLATGRFAAVERHETRWERTVPIAAHLAELATHSWVIRLGAGIDDYLAEQRFILEREFSDGLIREQYLCHLHVARVPL